ncbi:DUF4132 domain-containing protein [Kitasatospora sp. NBC_01287]|uniref:DUF4132 domain-containing protein n=1 Tax=Kitasatospora sp. NBC_01287 TaxID=2903573 RepID=UPI00225851CA|nr:DUF4132 domain-containing protein [Kitasatospora sp. NBC_01287]MCX4747895.1 DUF4132 domain-containing protein [Kitasatospora sp. NBC_01287]
MKRWQRLFLLGGEFPRVTGLRHGSPLRPGPLGRALVRAGRQDVLRSRTDGAQDAPATTALLDALPAATRREIALRLQHERTGLVAEDYEWAATVALREAHCGWRPEEVHELFALALKGVDPLHPTTRWLTTESCLELPLAAYEELAPAEREAFHPYLRTLLAVRFGCHTDFHGPDQRPDPEQRAFAERLRALLPTEVDTGTLLPADDPFASAARCGLGATLYQEPALRLLGLCADATELRPDYRWLGRVREALQLAPALKEPLRVLLAAGYGEPTGCPAKAWHAGPPSERGGQLLGALAWAAVVAEDHRAIQHLGLALRCHAGRAMEELPPGAAHFIRAGLAALAALAGESGAGRHRRLLTAQSPAAARLAREELAAVRDLPAGVDLTGLTVPVGAYTAVFVFDPAGSVELRFRNQAGSLLTRVPSQVRERHPARYAALRSRLAELRGQLQTYRGALAERLVSDPGTPAARWRAAFLDSPGPAALTRTLVWEIDGRSGPVRGLPVRRAGSEHWLLRDLAGQVHELADDTLVRLWHPHAGEPAQAEAWRAALAERGLRQPVAQLQEPG